MGQGSAAESFKLMFKLMSDPDEWKLGNYLHRDSRHERWQQSRGRMGFHYVRDTCCGRSAYRADGRETKEKPALCPGFGEGLEFGW